MAVSRDDLAALAELFADFGPVTPRRLFGGVGVYVDGVMFALAHGGKIYLKADDTTVPSFQERGSQPFSYTAKNGRRAVMSYWSLPAALYDDGDELARWAHDALAVARRGQTKRRR